MVDKYTFSFCFFKVKNPRNNINYKNIDLTYELS